MKSKMSSKLAGFLALVAGIWMSLSALAQAAMLPYTDIPSIYSPWLTDQIAYLYREGCVYVPRDKKFRGKDSLTRYDVAYLMGQVAHKLDGISSAAVTFSDVPKSHWAYQRVGLAAKSGLMKGFDDGTFRGDEQVSHYELAVIMDRALAKRNLSDYSHVELADTPRSHWAYKAVCSVCNRRVMEKWPDPSDISSGKFVFGGDEYLKRYEAMQWFCNLVEKLHE